MIASHPAQIKTLAMGRRWGKTVMSGAVAMAMANAGAHVAWMAPTYKNSRPLWRWSENTVGPLKRYGVDVSRAERVIQFPSGGFLGVYSADNPDAIRGEAFHLVILDEAARIGEETWQDAVQPTLADFGGRAILISTPKGKNWFYTEFVRAQNSAPEFAASFNAPTADNPNPNIRRAADLARTRVPEMTYRQEWLAQFVEGGVVFRNVRLQATCTPREPEANREYVIGADWGRTTDYTVFTVLDVRAKQMCALERFTQIDYPTQALRLEALSKRWNGATVIAEYNSMGGPMIEEMQRRNLPVLSFTTTNASKTLVIDALVRAFEFREIEILNDTTLITELEAYASEPTATGIKYGAPEGLHDDCVMSLALAWQGVSKTPQGQLFF